MNNKYYTPTIEEFHVGFEFEVKIATENEWVKAIYSYPSDDWFNVCYFPDEKKEISVPDCMRVKYLDKEGIESLGWVSWSNHPKHFYHPAGIKKFSDGTIQHNITLRIENNNIIAIRRYSESPINFNNFAEFYGICKNKSELKKLMQMLNIQQVK
jgi:hypothetical protein